MTWFVLLAVFIALVLIFRLWFPNIHFSLLAFPPEWRKFLEGHIEFYRCLGAEGRKKFERDVLDVMRRKNMEGSKGFVPSEQHRLLVAVGIATLFHAMAKRAPAFRRPIIIYPGKGFSEDYKPHKGRIAGMAMPRGPMFLAADSIRIGYDRKKDGYNPVLHELAHYLDFDLGSMTVADDAPVGLTAEQLEEWHQVRDRELNKLKNKKSPLNPYALSDSGELFAVAVEMFFENPGPLKAGSLKLYQLLCDYFRIDPLELYSRCGRDQALVKNYMMPCPNCQEEIEWGLAECPFCGGRLDASYLKPDEPRLPEEARKKFTKPDPRADQVNWLGMVGVGITFLGISASIVTVFAQLRFPWMEKAWPTLLLLFGCWVLWMRRRDLRYATFIPIAFGFLFRGLQLGLSREGWDGLNLIWPLFLFFTGFVWVFVCSPEWREKNDAMRWWPWPRSKDKDDK
jgi:MtfA peptidase